MKSILITGKILWQTGAKNDFYQIAENESVTQGHYLHEMKCYIDIEKQK